MKNTKRSIAMKAAWAKRKAKTDGLDAALAAIRAEAMPQDEVMRTGRTTKPILEEAHETIYGDREKTYGDPGKNLRNIAAYWTTYLRSKDLIGPDDCLAFDDVANMMVLLKIARLGNTPLHHDSMVDACGYLALADRVAREDVV